MRSLPLSRPAGRANVRPMSMPHAILAELSRGPLHGYALRTSLQRRLGFLWPVNHGQVYATLARLAADGAVTAAECETGTGAASSELRTGGRGNAPRARGRAAGRRSEGPERTWRRTAAGERLVAEWCARPVASTAAGGEIREKIASAIAHGDPLVLDAFLSRQIASCATLLDACRHEARLRSATAEPARRLLDRAALRLLEADLAWLRAVREARADVRA